MQIVNIAAYKFVGIPDPALWQQLLKIRCDELALKGTILLAGEGINLTLAGERDNIDQFLQFLRREDFFERRFTDLEIKESLSDSQPFRRMLVRLTKEIISMRHPVASPEGQRAPAIDAETLKTWIERGCDDEGRPLVLLDTRNTYEVEIGTFAGAVHLDIERFSEFPKAIGDTIAGAPELQEQKTIVSFCTGGIRCEKAALYLQELGVKHVFQLDGGILRYFEKTGGAHWQGECFVFDDRVALDPELKQSSHHAGRQVGSRTADA